MLPVFAEFAKGDEVLAIHGPREAPDAMGLFSPGGCFTWQTFQPSVAPLGAWLRKPETSLPELLDGLIRALPGFNVLVALSQQDPNLSPRPENAGKTRTLDYIHTARMAISGDFETYWNARGKNLRHTMKRQRNRLAREDITPRFEELVGETEMADAVANYARMESSGWKGEAGTAVGEADPQSRFYTKMLENFCRRGKGLVYRYWYNDKLVATDLCIHDDGTIIILKTTYDETEKTTSPSQLMRQDAFQKFFDGGWFDGLEFYGPVKDWHTKLSDDVRTMYHVNRYRWWWLATMRGR